MSLEDAYRIFHEDDPVSSESSAPVEPVQNHNQDHIGQYKFTEADRQMVIPSTQKALPNIGNKQYDGKVKTKDKYSDLAYQLDQWLNKRYAGTNAFTSKFDSKGHEISIDSYGLAKRLIDDKFAKGSWAKPGVKVTYDRAWKAFLYYYKTVRMGETSGKMRS